MREKTTVAVIGGGPGGYVAADPGAFIEYYHGPEDIPKEWRDES